MNVLGMFLHSTLSNTKRFFETEKIDHAPFYRGNFVWFDFGIESHFRILACVNGNSKHFLRVFQRRASQKQVFSRQRSKHNQINSTSFTF